MNRLPFDPVLPEDYAPKDFSDISQSMLPRSLHIASISLIVVLVLFRLLVAVVDSADMIRETSIVMLILAGILTQICLRLKRVKEASFILLGFGMASLSYMSVAGGVGSNYALGGYMIIMFLTIVLLPGRSWLVVLLGAIASISVSQIVSHNLAGHGHPISGHIIDGAVQIIYLIMAATTVGMLYRRIGKILAEAQKTNKALGIANAAIRKSLNHSQVLMETAINPFFLVNAEQDIVAVNERACELFGYSHEQFLQMKIGEIEPEVTRDKVQNAFTKMIRLGKFSALHAKPVKQDGTKFSAEIHGQRVEFEDGELFYFVVTDTTERVAREEQLQEQAERLQLINDNVPIRIAQFDKELRIKYANAAVVKTHAIGQPVGKSLQETVGAEYYDQIHTHFKKALAGESVQYEEISEKNSKTSMVQLVPHFIGDEVVGVLATGIDITARKKAEAELTEKTDLLEMIASNLPARIAYFDKESNLQFINKAFKAAYIQGEISLPVHASALISDEAWKRREKFIADMLASGENATFELEEHMTNGEIAIVQKTYVPHIVDGEIVGRVSLGVDITELRQTQQNLQRSNDIFDHVINNVPARITYLDRDGKIIFVNDRLEEHFGVTAAQATGKSYIDILPADYVNKIRPYIRKTIRSQKDVVFDSPLVIADNSTIIERSYYFPHLVGDKVDAIFTMHMDVTDARNTEDSLAKAQKLESLGVLAGGIAHDFNNLLVAMLAQNSLALAKIEENHKARRHIVQAIAASKRAATLTQQMLAYSGRGSFVIGPLCLNDLIQNNLNLFAVSIPKSVQLVTNLHAELPLIEADMAQMQQLIMNLIINAGQAIGGEHGFITITTTIQNLTTEGGDFWKITGDPLIEGQYVSIEIEDDGAGMDEETVSNIFDPFYTTKESGTGLGLAAALGIIRGHKGGIRLRSELGKGTVFHLLFPVLNPSELSQNKIGAGSAETTNDLPIKPTAQPTPA